jgi:hypothetical protein
MQSGESGEPRMSGLTGHSILIVVDGETGPVVQALQDEVEREGADTLVAGDHPDTFADTLATFDFTAAVVSIDQQEAVAALNVPTVVFYEGDTPEQILARLRRALE